MALIVAAIIVILLCIFAVLVTRKSWALTIPTGPISLISVERVWPFVASGLEIYLRKHSAYIRIDRVSLTFMLGNVIKKSGGYVLTLSVEGLYIRLRPSTQTHADSSEGNHVQVSSPFVHREANDPRQPKSPSYFDRFAYYILNRIYVDISDVQLDLEPETCAISATLDRFTIASDLSHTASSEVRLVSVLTNFDVLYMQQGDEESLLNILSFRSQIHIDKRLNPHHILLDPDPISVGVPFHRLEDILNGLDRFFPTQTNKSNSHTPPPETVQNRGSTQESLQFVATIPSIIISLDVKDKDCTHQLTLSQISISLSKACTLKTDNLTESSVEASMRIESILFMKKFTLLPPVLDIGPLSITSRTVGQQSAHNVFVESFSVSINPTLSPFAKGLYETLSSLSKRNQTRATSSHSKANPDRAKPTSLDARIAVEKISFTVMCEPEAYLIRNKAQFLISNIQCRLWKNETETQTSINILGGSLELHDSHHLRLGTGKFFKSNGDVLTSFAFDVVSATSRKFDNDPETIQIAVDGLRIIPTEELCDTAMNILSQYRDLMNLIENDTDGNIASSEADEQKNISVVMSHTTLGFATSIAAESGDRHSIHAFSSVPSMHISLNEGFLNFTISNFAVRWNGLEKENDIFALISGVSGSGRIRESVAVAVGKIAVYWSLEKQLALITLIAYSKSLQSKLGAILPTKKSAANDKNAPFVVQTSQIDIHLDLHTKIKLDVSIEQVTANLLKKEGCVTSIAVKADHQQFLTVQAITIHSQSNPILTLLPPTWALDIVKFHFTLPIGCHLGPCIQSLLDTNSAMKAYKKQIGLQADSEDFMDVFLKRYHIKFIDLKFEIPDDPFTWSIWIASLVQLDESEQRVLREAAFQKKIQEKYPSQTQSVKQIERLKAKLSAKNHALYRERIQSIKEDATHGRNLLLVSFSSLDLFALKSPRCQNDDSLIQIIQSLDSDEKQPQFDELWGRELTVTASKMQVKLRSLIKPLMHFDGLLLKGIMVFAEMAAQGPSLKHRSVAAKTFGSISISSSLLKPKVFHDFDAKVENGEIHYGPALLPMFADLSANIDRLQPPSMESSPPLPWWDTMRLMLHGKLRMTISKSAFNIYAGNFPKLYDKCLHMRMRELQVDYDRGCIRMISSDFDAAFSRTVESRKVEVKVMETPEVEIVTALTWICKGDPYRHYVCPMPASIPDTYVEFRSQGLDLVVKLNAPKVTDRTTEFTIDADSARSFEQLIASVSRQQVLVRPYMQKLPPKSVSFGDIFNKVSIDICMPGFTATLWQRYQDRLSLGLIVQSNDLSVSYQLSHELNEKNDVEARARKEWASKDVSVLITNLMASYYTIDQEKPPRQESLMEPSVQLVLEEEIQPPQQQPGVCFMRAQIMKYQSKQQAETLTSRGEGQANTSRQTAKSNDDAQSVFIWNEFRLLWTVATKEYFFSWLRILNSVSRAFGGEAHTDHHQQDDDDAQDRKQVSENLLDRLLTPRDLRQSVSTEKVADVDSRKDLFRITFVNPKIFMVSGSFPGSILLHAQESFIVGQTFDGKDDGVARPWGIQTFKCDTLQAKYAQKAITSCMIDREWDIDDRGPHLVPLTDLECRLGATYKYPMEDNDHGIMILDLNYKELNLRMTSVQYDTFLDIFNTLILGKSTEESVLEESKESALFEYQLANDGQDNTSAIEAKLRLQKAKLSALVRQRDDIISFKEPHHSLEAIETQIRLERDKFMKIKGQLEIALSRRAASGPQKSSKSRVILSKISYSVEKGTWTILDDARLEICKVSFSKFQGNANQTAIVP
eukprot:TRINITY_DN2011_c0_g1_i1.p1 TRINITY_DN2011_c0_g1~~TRINITY_DN2011_c0_g1_i1.p1  ORF type:complete len:1793 (+),score=331.40 TRINITY_DN2011_c0_g1_i1:103-5481(+)